MTSPEVLLPPARRVDTARVAELYRQLLVALGEDPGREGLRGTPERVAAWWQEFLDHDPGRTDTVFAQELTPDSEQMVVVGGLSAWSLCEHHLLPMRLRMTVGYRPDGHVLGLSKVARIVSAHAHRLQVQERLVDAVATEVATVAGVADVGVVADGEHLCMIMRGVREQQSRTISYSFRGCFDASLLGDRLLTLARYEAGR
ncbi:MULTISPECIES: GTP cyclohydrolase I [Streptomyces]|uniref:GTP cyclohydrolase I n=1 Tax=Streptomyces TaxID=1883 RepID=UPI00163C474D|nr:MULTISPECIES: GTP cyclohydrolase I FolE [Streptomyces]MBC2879323.1 GTP cyclohydrolase I FolE [Streptomyces sp. TYQ1024]UBI40078.1 GTP cyclohydrolase I [Streptomyces mobaraensis]UKW32657.1 GTP cyclohydrolase I [Streptomyces sp. TYQ1024]